MKTVGILGGMGPVATAELYNRIIKLCQIKYNAAQDSDYPKIVLYSLPLSGTDETGVIDEKSAILDFKNAIRRIEASGVDFIVIPCNTEFHLLKHIRRHAKVPIIDLIEETVKRVKSARIKKAGIISSDTTRKMKLYETALCKNFIEPVIQNDTDQKKTTKVILHVMEGKHTAKDKQNMIRLIHYMKKKGVEGVILACTELSLVASQRDTNVKLFDSLDILAEASIKKAYE